MIDRSNGYEKHAETFIRSRDSFVGVAVVREWAHSFARGAQVLELGCGHGVISEVLVEAGVVLFAVDVSPTLLQAFRQRFPSVETDCSPAEESSFFGRKFDGVVAWGLLFLLEEECQLAVLAKVAIALLPGGRFLFTAPREAIEWTDVLTGCPSRSLGVTVYEQALRALGLEVSTGVIDEGENHYYSATKPYDHSETVTSVFNDTV